MNRGFTLIEVLVVIAIVGFVLAVTFSKCCSSDSAFALSEPKDIKIIVDPKTGEASECVRPWVFRDWVCRPMKIKEKPAEREE